MKTGVEICFLSSPVWFVCLLVMNAHPCVHTAFVHARLCSFTPSLLSSLSSSCYLTLISPLARVFLFTLLHLLSLSCTLSFTLSFSAAHSLSFTLLTVKPFWGPLVCKHQKLSCQMHQGREEWILFTANQQTKSYTADTCNYVHMHAKSE